MLKELVEGIVKKLVDNPADVSVTQVSGESGTVIELRVASEDLGKVIGREGRTARSIRTLLQVAAVKEGVRVSLEILE